MTIDFEFDDKAIEYDDRDLTMIGLKQPAVASLAGQGPTGLDNF